MCFSQNRFRSTYSQTIFTARVNGNILVGKIVIGFYHYIKLWKCKANIVLWALLVFVQIRIDVLYVGNKY